MISQHIRPLFSFTHKFFQDDFNSFIQSSIYQRNIHFIHSSINSPLFHPFIHPINQSINQPTNQPIHPHPHTLPTGDIYRLDGTGVPPLIKRICTYLMNCMHKKYCYLIIFISLRHMFFSFFKNTSQQ